MTNIVMELNNIQGNGLSIIKVLFIFYLVMTLCSSDLLGHQYKEFVQDNRMVQHIIAFMLMVTLITLITEIRPIEAIMYALIAYAWFVVSTKLDLHWTVLILSALFVGYLHEISLEQKEKELLEDATVDPETAGKITNSHRNNRRIVMGTLSLVVLIGTLFYSHKKHTQYGGGYDIGTYLFY